MTLRRHWISSVQVVNKANGHDDDADDEYSLRRTQHAPISTVGVALVRMAVVVQVHIQVHHIQVHTAAVVQVHTARVLHIRTVSCRRCVGNNTNTANTEASIRVNLRRVAVHTVALHHYRTEVTEW